MQAEECEVCFQHPKHCAMTKTQIEILLILLVATICLFSKITAYPYRAFTKLTDCGSVVVAIIIITIDYLRLWLVFPSSQRIGFEPNICWGLHQGILK
jgi:hypothetical protein